jgi:hypothetical protein
MPVHCAPREGGALRSRGVAQSGSAPALGAGCRGFESLHPDHYLSSLPQRGVSLRVCCLNARQLLDGGCSSPGRAPDCGSGGSGFETRQPPHPFCAQVADPSLFEALCRPFVCFSLLVRPYPELIVGRRSRCKFRRAQKEGGDPCPRSRRLRAGLFGRPWPPVTRLPS